MAKTISTINQEKILVKKPAGNLSNFEIIYDQYAPALLGIVEINILNKQKSTEVLEIVFQEIWNKTDEFDSQKMRLFTWLYQLTCTTVIAYNKVTTATVIKAAIRKMYESFPEGMPANHLTGYAD